MNNYQNLPSLFNVYQQTPNQQFGTFQTSQFSSYPHYQFPTNGYFYNYKQQSVKQHPKNDNKSFVSFLISSIIKYFPFSQCYTEQEITKMFGPYMTGIKLCVLIREKLVTIYINDNLYNIQDLGHYVFCSQRINNLHKNLKLTMLAIGTQQQPKDVIDLMENNDITYMLETNTDAILIKLINGINFLLQNDVQNSHNMELA